MFQKISAMNKKSYFNPFRPCLKKSCNIYVTYGRFDVNKLQYYKQSPLHFFTGEEWKLLARQSVKALLVKKRKILKVLQICSHLSRMFKKDRIVILLGIYFKIVILHLQSVFRHLTNALTLCHCSLYWQFFFLNGRNLISWGNESWLTTVFKHTFWNESSTSY